MSPMMTERRGPSVSSHNPPDHMKTDAPLVHVVADLSGYPDLEYISSIQTSKHYVVFRAISNKYGPCVVKATSKTPTQVEVEQLKREYQKLRLCDSDSIVSVYDLYDHQSSLGVALVSMECGLSLKAWAQKQPENPSLETVLDIGIQIARGLDHLHRHARLIHGDISPNNVCYCQDTKRAVIIDLGGAHGFSEPGTVFTPAYHSPEQARGVSDHRSDLYSLGVLLFQLFTGHMPIQGRTPEQFRIAHLLEKPLLVSNVRDCHPMFEKIIDKLLQKRPDERYMTAAGLTHDLQCLREIIKTDTEGKASFNFGTHEVPFIFPLPNELIGRSEELSALDRLYNSCIKPEQGAFCSLHGKPGVGKSALIQTFALQHRNPFFFSFKFNQFGNAPMHAIIQIMTQVAHQTVRSDQFNDHNIQKEFLDRLRDCDVLRALVDLVPAYDKLIPSPDTIPEGLAADVQKILYPAIAHVLTETRKFCGKPIVLFFDDIQWIDPGSKGVLSFLLGNCIPVLVIVAFRDYSSQSVFTLESLLNKDGLKSMKMPSIDLSLHDLSQENVNELIQSLALPDQDKNMLSSTMYQQTEGNPFFLRFRLSTMAATKALTYHVESRLWRLNKDRMDLTTEVIAADAVEFCVSVLGRLDRDVTRVLCRLAMMPQGLTVDEYASVLEHEAGVVELSKAKSCTIAEAIQNAATVGFQKNILVRTENGFKFAHDRLQHSARQVCDARESSEIHYYLGKQALPTASSMPEQAFQVLDHFSKSRELVTDKDLILRICGIMSSVCAFYVTAGSHEHLDGMLEFTRELLSQLDEDTRNSGAVECLEVRLLIAHHKIKFLMKDLDAAGELFDEVRPHLHFAEEIRDAYHTRISLLINSGSHRQAIETAAEALSRLDDYSLLPGLTVPDGQPAAVVGEVTEQIQNMLGKNTGWDIARAANSLAVSTDEDFNFRVELLISVIASVYLSGLFDLYLYISAMACKRILDNGATRSGGHAFSVLGFALVAIFGDSFGAEVAMFGKHLVDRFDNPVAVCRAYALSGAAIIYDERYEHLSSRMLYDSYLAGRSAHDILWSNYAVYLLCIMVVFEGLALSEVRKTLEDPFVYVMNSGQQALAQGGVRAVLHMVSILMGTKSTEGSTVYHFSIPSDEVTKSQPLVGFTHGAISLVALYFDGKLEIAWQIISEIVANDLATSAPGNPPFYTFHFYAVVVAHGLLLKSMAADCNQEEPGHLSKNVCDQLLDQIKNSTDELRRLSGMACVFDPYKDIAEACILEVIESKPLDALQKFESVVNYLHDKRPGKNYDLIAISHLLSAGISKRLKLRSVHHMYNAKAVATLEKWGALSVAKRIAKSDTTVDFANTEPDSGSSQPHDSLVHDSHTSPDAGGHVDGVPAAVWSNGHGYVSATQSTRARLGPDFASILASAGYITSFSTFEELTAGLCTTLLAQATATRLVLFIRDQKSGVLEPAAECALGEMSPMESLKNMEYSIPVVKVTEQLQERVIVHSAQQESPHCFEPYVQRSGICSIASFPISYQGSLVACVYMEHAFKQGLFTHDIIETTTLLGHHVASAIVNALLLRDLRSRTAQLEQSHAVLAKALKVKDTILSNTSHELRSPLNGIIGLNEYILSSRKPLDPEVHNCLKTTLALARQQLHLISDILDMSKIHAGALQLNYETASLYALVKEVFDVAMFTSNNVRLINKISQTFPEVMVDPLRLKQVIMNLTSNAIKFTPEGSVTISCELLDDKKTFVLTVADTGIGIDPSHLDIIFEQFGQVEAYESREHQGTGLGLSITKQLVSLHGGRIDVFSTVGVGTTFQVFIPSKPCNSFSTQNERGCSSSLFRAFASTESLKSGRDQSELTLDSARLNAICDGSISSVKPESEASAAAAVITTGPDTQPKHVPPVSIPEQQSIATELIGSDYATGKETNDGHRVDSLDDVPLRVVAVDDTAINLKVLSNFLVKDGMEVTTVSNGKKLLEILSGYKWINYDVILLDWMMPVMDGITACRLVRERIQTDLLPIMFLTAKSDPADMQKGFEAGGTDYALKPFNRHEIIARTRSLGKSARRARALYHDSIPAALKLLTRDPFWKIQSAVKTMPMFVICVHSGSPEHNDHHSGIDGPTLLRLFRAQQLLSDSEWSFCEVDERSVSFLVAMTNVQQVRVLLRTALANLDWIESQVAKSASSHAHHDKPMITVGIDHRHVTAHLLADKLPMLAAVESPVADAKRLARTGMKHEEFILSESAKMVLNSRYCA